MNPYAQRQMIARCAVQSKTQDGATGRWTPLVTCGVFPAQLDADGNYLCGRHFAQFWQCANCEAVGATMDAIRWSPLGDAGYCSACWSTVEEALTDED